MKPASQFVPEALGELRWHPSAGKCEAPSAISEPPRFRGKPTAAWCEGHHVRPWEHGGPTQLPHLVLVCTRHHHLLHTPAWHAKLLPDATLEITNPQGHTRTTTPPNPSRAPPLPLRE